MKAVQSVLAVLLLAVLAGMTATTVQARHEENGRKAAELEVEANGWKVAYADELTEQELERGEVAPGVFIYAKRDGRGMDALHEWADSLVRQAAALQPRRTVADFDLSAQAQARRLTVRIIRELLGGRASGDELLEIGALELKAGVMEYMEYREQEARQKPWSQYQDEEVRVAERIFVPYVGIRTKHEESFRRWRKDRNERQDQDRRQEKDYDEWPDSKWERADQSADEGWKPRQEPPVIQQQILPVAPPEFSQQQRRVEQQQHYPAHPNEIFKALSLTNTARRIGKKRWEWTAYIDGPKRFLRRIKAVTYYLHPSFTPSVQQGDASKKGHPLTAIGWGVFRLRAEVVLDNGSKRIYEHKLQF